MVNVSSPVLIMEPNQKILQTSPTSTTDLHNEAEMDVDHNVNYCSSIDRLTASAGELSAGSFACKISKKNEKVVLKTIHHGEIKINKPFYMVLDLKAQLCCNTVLDMSDIMIIRGGKELSNSESIQLSDLQTSKVFVMVRTTTKTTIPIALKTLGIEGGQNKTLKVPLNIKVFQLKKQLFRGKITTVRPESQRIIVGGKVLSDQFIIGDYLLQSLLSTKAAGSAQQSKPNFPSSSSIGNSSGNSTSPTSQQKSLQPLATLYLSKTTNTKHEIDVSVHTGLPTPFVVSLEISQPIGMLNTILNKRFRFPMPSEQMAHIFSAKMAVLPGFKATPAGCIEMADGTIATASNSMLNSKKPKKSVAKGEKKESFKLVELDQSKTLLDYGYTQSTKTLSVELARMAIPPKIETRPPNFKELLFTFLATVAAEQVRREAAGLPLINPSLAADKLSIPVSRMVPVDCSPANLAAWQAAMAGPSLSFGVDASEGGAVNGADVMAALRNALGAAGMRVSDAQLAQMTTKIASATGASLPDTVSSSNVSSSSGSSHSKGDSSPVSVAAAPSAVSSTSAVLAKPAAPPSKKRPADCKSGSSGGLFGGLKKGFLGGSNKKKSP